MKRDNKRNQTSCSSKQRITMGSSDNVSQMKRIHCEILKTRESYLIRNVNATEQLISKLYAAAVISEDMKGDIEKCDKEKKVPELLALLPSRGPDAFSNFCTCLAQCDHVYVKEHLEKTEAIWIKADQLIETLNQCCDNSTQEAVGLYLCELLSIQPMTEECERYAEIIAQLRIKLNRSSLEHKDAVEENAELKRQLKQHKKKEQKHKETWQELKKHKEKEETYKKQIAELKRQLEEHKEKEQTRKESWQELKKHKEKEEKYKAEIKGLRENLSTCKQLLEDTVKEMKAKRNSNFKGILDNVTQLKVKDTSGAQASLNCLSNIEELLKALDTPPLVFSVKYSDKMSVKDKIEKLIAAIKRINDSLVGSMLCRGFDVKSKFKSLCELLSNVTSDVGKLEEIYEEKERKDKVVQNLIETFQELKRNLEEIRNAEQHISQLEEDNQHIVRNAASASARKTNNELIKEKKIVIKLFQSNLRKNEENIDSLFNKLHNLSNDAKHQSLEQGSGMSSSPLGKTQEEIKFHVKTTLTGNTIPYTPIARTTKIQLSGLNPTQRETKSKRGIKYTTDHHLQSLRLPPIGYRDYWKQRKPKSTRWRTPDQNIASL